MINGIYFASHNDNKEIASDNSTVKFKQNILGKILKILIKDNEIFFVLKVNYKIVEKKQHSQYFKVEKLSKEIFYVKNVKTFESRAILCENSLYFVLPPNTVEGD